MLQPVVVYKAIREGAHGVQLEKSLLLPFNIITVVLTDRQVTVGECQGQLPEGKRVCLRMCSESHALLYMDRLPVAHLAKHFQFINTRPSMRGATSCQKNTTHCATVYLHHLNHLLAVGCCPSAVQSKHYSCRWLLLLFVCDVVVLPPA